MADAEYSKLQIALEYIDAAMQFYIDRRNYFCAIHLAAAAAELFDKHLPKENSTFEISRRAQKAMHQIETGNAASKRYVKNVLLYSKNTIKHMDDENSTAFLDPIFEAQWWIDHALISFEKLKLNKTPIIWRYQDCRNAEMRSRIG